jgi:hypothetical protein
MADIVLGKDYLLTAYQTDGYYPIACLQEVRLIVSTELLPATHYNSPVWTAVQPRRSSWRLSSSGVHILRDQAETKLFAYDLIRDQIRQSGLDIRLVTEDQGGYTRTIEGHVYPSETEIGGVAGQIGKWVTELIGSGTLTIDGAITINPGTVQVFEYTATGGETVVTDASLVGRSIKWVDREDSNQKVITVGTPSGREVKYDSSAGSLTFGSAFYPSEYVKVLYEG